MKECNYVWQSSVFMCELHQSYHLRFDTTGGERGKVK